MALHRTFHAGGRRGLGRHADVTAARGRAARREGKDSDVGGAAAAGPFVRRDEDYATAARPRRLDDGRSGAAQSSPDLAAPPRLT